MKSKQDETTCANAIHFSLYRPSPIYQLCIMIITGSNFFVSQKNDATADTVCEQSFNCVTIVLIRKYVTLEVDRVLNVDNYVFVFAYMQKEV